jgi:hypothetical protein
MIRELGIATAIVLIRILIIKGRNLVSADLFRISDSLHWDRTPAPCIHILILLLGPQPSASVLGQNCSSPDRDCMVSPSLGPSNC